MLHRSSRRTTGSLLNHIGNQQISINVLNMLTSSQHEINQPPKSIQQKSRKHKSIISRATLVFEFMLLIRAADLLNMCDYVNVVNTLMRLCWFAIWMRATDSFAQELLRLSRQRRWVALLLRSVASVRRRWRFPSPRSGSGGRAKRPALRSRSSRGFSLMTPKRRFIEGKCLRSF